MRFTVNNSSDLEEGVERLEQLRSGSPYPVEPPRRSPIVNAFMRMADHTGHRVTWPEYGSHTTALVQVEYDSDTRNFWAAFEGEVDLSDLEGADVLDIGCGWAGKAIRYAEAVDVRSMCGFDLPGVFEPAIPAQFARDRGVENCHFATGHAENMPFADASFDIALMDDVFEHVHDPWRVLAECHRILRPGGKVAARFPSIRMMKAHHFDRALSYPGLHYLMSMKTWAAGLNYCLLEEGPNGSRAYEPFTEVQEEKFGRLMPRDLSGLDFKSFSGLVNESKLKVRRLKLVGMTPTRRQTSKTLTRLLYETLRRVPGLQEFMSSSIAFVGER